MAKRTSTINPDEVSFILDDHLVDGYTNGTQISVVYNNDGFIPFVGNTGETARVATNDYSAIIEVTLMQSSLSNDVFSEKHNTDLRNGDNVFDVAFKDNKGTTTLDGSGAYILKFADVTIGNTVESRVWRVYVGYLEGVVGGNFTQ